MDYSLPGSSVDGISQARILVSGLPFPTPRDLPELGIEPSLLLLLHWQVDSLLLHHMGSPKENRTSYNTKTVQYTEWSLIMDAETKTLSL